MAAFLGFLAKIGRLSGDDPETLTAAVARLRVRFERYARDPRNWGPAKAMVMQMRAEGIDPFEPGALEAGPRGFNACPFAARDRLVGRVQRQNDDGLRSSAPAAPIAGRHGD